MVDGIETRRWDDRGRAVLASVFLALALAERLLLGGNHEGDHMNGYS